MERHQLKLAMTFSGYCEHVIEPVIQAIDAVFRIALAGGCCQGVEKGEKTSVYLLVKALMRLPE